MAARLSIELRWSDLDNCGPCRNSARGKEDPRTGDRGAAILAERYECLVKILFGLESRSKLKGFT